MLDSGIYGLGLERSLWLHKVSELEEEVKDWPAEKLLASINQYEANRGRFEKFIDYITDTSLPAQVEAWKRVYKKKTV